MVTEPIRPWTLASGHLDRLFYVLVVASLALHAGILLASRPARTATLSVRAARNATVAVTLIEVPPAKPARPPPASVTPPAAPPAPAPAPAMVTAMATAAPTPVAPAVSVPAPASAAASPPTELAPAAPAPAPVEPATEVPGALTLSQPTYLDNPAPVYPPLARRRGWEGVTVLRVEVLADGTLRGIGVVRSSGHRVLDDTALAAVRRWRFRPARRGAQPVISQLEIPIRFQLLGD